MNPEEFYKKMLNLLDDYDIEDGHYAMDELMCEALKSLGYEKGVKVFENAERWYA